MSIAVTFSMDRQLLISISIFGLYLYLHEIEKFSLFNRMLAARCALSKFPSIWQKQHRMLINGTQILFQGLESDMQIIHITFSQECHEYVLNPLFWIERHFCRLKDKGGDWLDA